MFYPASIIPSWLSFLIYHMMDEQQACCWPQFRDVFSPHKRANGNIKVCAIDILIFICGGPTIMRVPRACEDLNPLIGVIN
jgi:hypothetical protein